MVTSIQISEETRKKLLMIMAEIQKKEKRKITYEEAITFLINREEKSLEKRKEFANNYRGVINVEQAQKDLIEARNLER